MTNPPQTRHVVVAVLVALLAASTACSSNEAPNAANTTTTRAGSDGSASTVAVSPVTLPAGDAPAAHATGPITGGKYGVPFNSMPAGLADQYGYREHEYFIDGNARTYLPEGELTADGAWTVRPSTETAPYTLRVIARRPDDPAKFNGTVLVEWFNVSAGMDADPDFGLAHIELLRSGYAYVGVSAQVAGVEGGGGVLPIPGFDPPALKEVDPQRYSSLEHPGDDYSYDIFAQVGAMLRRPNGIDVLDGLAPQRILAAGESQSAGRMTTFVNAVHPVTHVYDGFFIHSRGNFGTPINAQAGAQPPGHALIRTDLDVPVMQFVTETDLFFLGFYGARQPDTERIRTWEVAGTAHADQTTLDYGLASGKVSVPDVNVDFAATCGAMNDGPQTYVVRKAIDALNTWVRDGTPPATAEPLTVHDGAIARDEHGNALGGIRTPAVDAPTATLSGDTSTSTEIFCRAFGSTTPFDAATLHALYPSHQGYVDAVTRASAAAVDSGHLLPADKAIIDSDAQQAPIPG